jgi:hypothetical protein
VRGRQAGKVDRASVPADAPLTGVAEGRNARGRAGKRRSKSGTTAKRRSVDVRQLYGEMTSDASTLYHNTHFLNMRLSTLRDLLERNLFPGLELVGGLQVIACLCVCWCALVLEYLSAVCVAASLSVCVSVCISVCHSLHLFVSVCMTAWLCVG